MQTPLYPSLPTPSKVEKSEETQQWRRSLLDVFRHIYRCVYNDIISSRIAVNSYLLTDNDSDPYTILYYGTWTLDKTDGDGVRFWRRTA